MQIKTTMIPYKTKRMQTVVSQLAHSFNQRARDSSSLERTKIPRRIVRFFVGFFVFWGSAHFCTLFAHRRESCVFPCIVCILCIVSRACRGKAPPSCWRKTALSLKSSTGAFIAALRSQTQTLLCKILVGKSQTLQICTVPAQAARWNR